MAVKAQLDACGNEPDEEEFYQFRAQRRRGAKRKEDLLRARQLDDTWRIRRDLAACLPSEHRDSATDIWQSAQKALGEPLTWPENLGKGKPFEK